MTDGTFRNSSLRTHKPDVLTKERNATSRGVRFFRRFGGFVAAACVLFLKGLGTFETQNKTCFCFFSISGRFSMG